MTPNLLNGESAHGETSVPRGAHSTTHVADALRVMRSRSPDESLGVNIENGLVKSSVQAGVIAAFLLVALTAGPYLWAKVFPPAPKAEKSSPADAPAPKDTPTAAPGTPDATAKKTPDATVAVPGKAPAKKDITDVLGETGLKKGNPADPFNKKDDDLLKDLK